MLLFSFWKSILSIIIVFIVSLAPPSNFESIPTFQGLDKLVHLCMYFVLSLMLTFDYKKVLLKHTIRLSLLIVCVIFPILLGIAIEFIQEYAFPPRTGSLGDVASNSVGVILAWIVMHKKWS